MKYSVDTRPTYLQKLNDSELPQRYILGFMQNYNAN